MCDSASVIDDRGVDSVEGDASQSVRTKRKNVRIVGRRGNKLYKNTIIIIAR